MTDVSPETVERMIALVRSVADVRKGHDTHPGSWFGLQTRIGDEARAIAAELPAPVDPDAEIAKALVGPLDIWGTYRAHEEAHILAIVAIKRGRTLATQGDR